MQIVSPAIDEQSPIPVGTDVIIRWQGSDPDGHFTQVPLRYRYALFGQGLDIDAAWANPDAFRDQFAPDFANWAPAASDSPSLPFSNLNDGGRYLFCVVGFDEAEAYSARFARGKNMVLMQVNPSPTKKQSSGGLKARYR